MSEPVDRIRSLIDSLPKRDISLGYEFLNKRNFDSLKELIDSAIYKIKKSLISDNPKEEYLKVNLEDLSRLKSEVDTYIVQIDIPEDNIYNEDFNDYEIEEDFY